MSAAARKPSLSRSIRSLQERGLAIVRVELLPGGGFSIFTAGQEPANVPDELERAREARRAREAGRA